MKVIALFVAALLLSASTLAENGRDKAIKRFVDVIHSKDASAVVRDHGEWYDGMPVVTIIVGNRSCLVALESDKEKAHFIACKEIVRRDT